MLHHPDVGFPILSAHDSFDELFVVDVALRILVPR